MIEVKEGIVASKATIARLPIYLRYLRDLHAAGEENVSSTKIAEDMKLNPVQVRKDLALISGVPGKPKLGFGVGELIGDLERFLGCDNVFDALLVGAGGLGRTLLGYEGFKNYGLNIVAAFDVDPARIGTKINSVPVLGLDKLEHTASSLNVKLGIVTVPKAEAQLVADLMVKSGIRGIWNFAPVQLKLPDEVVVKYEDLAASLAVLSKRLSDAIKKSEQ